MDDDRELHRDAETAAEAAGGASAAPAPADAEVDRLFDDWLAGDAGAAAPAPAGRAADELDAATVHPDRMPTLLDALGTDAAIAAVEAAGSASELAPAVARRQFVLFTVATGTYAVLETLVTEVARVPKITPVPRVPAWLRGVASLRGEVLSVIDLRTLLGLEPASLHTSRLLVVRLLDEEFSVGLVVDAVEQIAGIPDADVRPPASPIEGPLGAYLTGVGQVKNRLVAVLDLEALLHSAEIRQFDDTKDAEPAA